MTTVRSPRTVPPSDADESGPGERLRRRRQRRRLLREEFLAVLVLFFALAATVAVLAMQWLGSGSSVGTAAPAAPAHISTISTGGPA
jgi:hypothetical protein